MFIPSHFQLTVVWYMNIFALAGSAIACLWGARGLGICGIQ